MVRSDMTRGTRTAFAAPSSAEAMVGVDAMKVEYATKAKLLALTEILGRLKCFSCEGTSNAEVNDKQIAATRAAKNIMMATLKNCRLNSLWLQRSTHVITMLPMYVLSMMASQSSLASWSISSIGLFWRKRGTWNRRMTLSTCVSILYRIVTYPESVQCVCVLFWAVIKSSRSVRTFISKRSAILHMYMCSLLSCLNGVTIQMSILQYTVSLGVTSTHGKETRPDCIEPVQTDDPFSFNWLLRTSKE